MQFKSSKIGAMLESLCHLSDLVIVNRQMLKLFAVFKIRQKEFQFIIVDGYVLETVDSKSITSQFRYFIVVQLYFLQLLQVV